jgi:SAM-dependent methyltransferase
MTVYTNIRQAYWRLREEVNTKKIFWNFRLTHSGNERLCNLCGWHGSSFYPWDNELDAMCPKCKSQPRHRYLKLMIEAMWLDRPEKMEKILHVAPKGERGLVKLFRSNSSGYLSIDLEPGAAMEVMDLTNMVEIPSNSIDFVCCNDVLEHIEDFSKAIAEIHRVIKPGGCAALMVPIYGDKTVKVEQPTPEDDMHVWHPGIDFFDYYKTQGFEVKVYYPEEEIKEPAFAYHSLRKVTLLPWCRKLA